MNPAEIGAALGAAQQQQQRRPPQVSQYDPTMVVIPIKDWQELQELRELKRDFDDTLRAKEQERHKKWQAMVDEFKDSFAFAVAEGGPINQPMRVHIKNLSKEEVDELFLSKVKAMDDNFQRMKDYSEEWRNSYLEERRKSWWTKFWE